MSALPARKTPCSLSIESQDLWCNDTHSHLNATPMLGAMRPRSVGEVQRYVRWVRERGERLSICGARHAMGRQQFARDAWLLDMRGMDRVIDLDLDRGLIHVEAGIAWPELMRHYVVKQHGTKHRWGIRQKQTGADRLTIGGALAANIHGRGLACAPFVDDIEALGNL